MICQQLQDSKQAKMISGKSVVANHAPEVVKTTICSRCMFVLLQDGASLKGLARLASFDMLTVGNQYKLCIYLNHGRHL